MPLVWQWIGKLAQLGCVTVALLFVSGLFLEGLLRVAGQKPWGPGLVLSDIVPDPYSGWQMRPNVQTGREQSITNNFGFHSRRDYSLERASQVERVIVQGSSVVYGLHCALEETLPRQIEKALQARGVSAEVLNFGVHGHSLLNTLGQTGAYTLQFQPGAAVIVLDIQMCYPEEPIPVPSAQLSVGTVKQLSLSEAAAKLGAPYFVVLSALASPSQAQERLKWLLKQFGKPQEGAENPSAAVHDQDLRNDTQGRPHLAEADVAEPGLKSLRASARSRRLRSVLAGVLAAYAETGVPAIVVTPFGPYYAVTDATLAKFSLHHLTPFASEYGGFREALHGELARMTADVKAVAMQYGAAVIDMTAENRKLRGDPPTYFSRDGIHPSPAGYSYLASRIVPALLDSMKSRRQKGT